MNSTDFETERARLTAIASRILGSPADADDVVQEAWLRLSATANVEDLPAWLTTVTTRLCLDHLRKRGTRAAVEAQVAAEASATEPAADPETDLLIAEQVSDAMQLVIAALAPAERAAFVLHDVFGYRFEEVGAALGRSAAAVRQMTSRARRKVRGLPESETERTARAESDHVVAAFLEAAHGGDLQTLLSLLAADATMHADAIGQDIGADPVYDGASAVAGRFNGAQGASPVLIDGERAGAWLVRGAARVAFIFHVLAGRVREIELIADPEVLATLDVVPVLQEA